MENKRVAVRALTTMSPQTITVAFRRSKEHPRRRIRTVYLRKCNCLRWQPGMESAHWKTLACLASHFGSKKNTRGNRRGWYRETSQTRHFQQMRDNGALRNRKRQRRWFIGAGEFSEERVKDSSLCTQSHFIHSPCQTQRFQRFQSKHRTKPYVRDPTRQCFPPSAIWCRAAKRKWSSLFANSNTTSAQAQSWPICCIC